MGVVMEPASAEAAPVIWSIVQPEWPSSIHAHRQQWSACHLITQQSYGWEGERRLTIRVPHTPPLQTPHHIDRRAGPYELVIQRGAVAVAV